jgi:two-component system cell cycle response regulator DivK
MSKCILVVEDQEDNRQILRDLLGNAGYELTEAENGEEAITAVARRRPDLILMDIQLPIMDGYEATRRIRTNPDLKSVPIIAVTSYALAGDEDKAFAAGCNGYVSKPYRRRCVPIWANFSRCRENTGPRCAADTARLCRRSDQIRGPFLLHCICPLLALLGH